MDAAAERVTAVSTVILWQVSMSPTHARVVCVHARAFPQTAVANYRKCAMNILMPPLPLILCYNNYIFLSCKPTRFSWRQNQVSMATAGGSQLSGVHIHTLQT